MDEAGDGPHALSMINVFEVETDEGIKHLVGFLDPVRAGAEGIDSNCMIGEFTPAEDGDFNLETFVVNPDFIAAFTEYMNGEPSRSAYVVEGAKAIPSQWLYVVDPRNQTDEGEDPPAHDIVGAFAVDETGQVVPGSFQYNQDHAWFSVQSGVSGLLEDRRFYDWLHPNL